MAHNTARFWYRLLGGAGLVVSVAALAVEPAPVSLQLSDLDKITGADQLTSLPGLAPVLSGLGSGNDTYVRIIYGNNRSQEYAGKLEQWLVAMGIERLRIATEIGVVEPDRLQVETQKR
ncbi:MAG: hypothetical protein OEZ10_03445 [Gammaproteobacteria bacterium]|nr:hypothetical protein [Gammaproteobacteria bacterium]